MCINGSLPTDIYQTERRGRAVERTTTWKFRVLFRVSSSASLSPDGHVNREKQLRLGIEPCHPYAEIREAGENLLPLYERGILINICFSTCVYQHLLITRCRQRLSVSLSQM